MNRGLAHHTLTTRAVVSTAAWITATRTVPAGSTSWGVGHAATAAAACGTGPKESTFASTIHHADCILLGGVVRVEASTTNVCGVRTSTPSKVPDVRNNFAARANARGTHSNRPRCQGGTTTGTQGRRHAA